MKTDKTSGYVSRPDLVYDPILGDYRAAKYPAEKKIVADRLHRTMIDDTIRKLHDAAGEAGDLEQVAICLRALDGDDEARAECERVINDADAQS